MPDDDRKHTRRYREVEQRALCIVERFAEIRKSAGLAVVAVHIAKQTGQLVEHRAVGTLDGVRDALADMLHQLVPIPTGTGDADDRHGQQPTSHQVVERRVDFLVTQIAGGAEYDECIGILALHILQSFFSMCPPKPSRIDDSSLSANSARPRDSKRAYNAALNTLAGTPTSMAA